MKVVKLQDGAHYSVKDKGYIFKKTIVRKERIGYNFVNLTTGKKLLKGNLYPTLKKYASGGLMSFFVDSTFKFETLFIEHRGADIRKINVETKNGISKKQKGARITNLHELQKAIEGGSGERLLTKVKPEFLAFIIKNFDTLEVEFLRMEECNRFDTYLDTFQITQFQYSGAWYEENQR